MMKLKSIRMTLGLKILIKFVQLRLFVI